MSTSPFVSRVPPDKTRIVVSHRVPEFSQLIVILDPCIDQILLIII